MISFLQYVSKSSQISSKFFFGSQPVFSLNFVLSGICKVISVGLALLSSYSVDNREYVQLTGFDIPNVEQQIYGISTGVVTGNTALIQWSTTQAANSSVRYSANNSQIWNVLSSDTKNTQHSILIDNLEPSTLYNLKIISGSVSAEYQILTNSLIDTTPPQILNFEVFNNDNEYLSISWYTDEKATEKIIIDKVENEKYLGDKISNDRKNKININERKAKGLGIVAQIMTLLECALMVAITLKQQCY